MGHLLKLLKIDLSSYLLNYHIKRSPLSYTNESYGNVFFLYLFNSVLPDDSGGDELVDDALRCRRDSHMVME